jgi:predicted dienelactone hydrolase
MRQPRAAATAIGVTLIALLASACGSTVTTGTPTTSASSVPTPTTAAATGPTGSEGARYTVRALQESIPSVRPDTPADPADVYAPVEPRPSGRPFPVALLLQGGFTDKGYYADYARQIATYGFTVVVPNHTRLLFAQNQLYAEQAQVLDAVQWMRTETADASSPLAGRLDASTLVLLGHSFGGVAALSAVEGTCRLPFCIVEARDYPAPPPELKAAALYGTNLASPAGDEIPAINTRGVPVAFIQGAQDSAATPQETADTYALMSGGPKAIITIAGTDHFGLTNFVDGKPVVEPKVKQTTDQAVSIETAARWSAQYLLAALGDPTAQNYVFTTGDAADPIVTVQSQP